MNTTGTPTGLPHHIFGTALALSWGGVSIELGVVCTSQRYSSSRTVLGSLACVLFLHCSILRMQYTHGNICVLKDILNAKFGQYSYTKTCFEGHKCWAIFVLKNVSRDTNVGQYSCSKKCFEGHDIY